MSPVLFAVLLGSAFGAVACSWLGLSSLKHLRVRVNRAGNFCKSCDAADWQCELHFAAKAVPCCGGCTHHTGHTVLRPGELRPGGVKVWNDAAEGTIDGEAR